MKGTRNKVLTLALSVQLLALPLMASAASYTDTYNNWAQADISVLSDQGILTGYPDGTFRPNGLITRAEFSAMLVKALGMTPNAGYGQSFNDVPRGHWAFPAIETIRATGLVSGYPNGQFMPSRSISRAEAMAILASAAQLQMPNEAAANQILSQYNDAFQVPAWARPAVAAAIQGGIFANNPSAGNTIQPLQPATRAEVAAMVQNLREGSNVARGGAQQTQPPGTYGSATVNQQGNQTTIQGRILTVPAQTAFTGTLTSPVSSELNKVGDTVVLRTDIPLVSSDGNHVIVPAGSQIVGQVSHVREAGRLERPAELNIDFTEIITPNGERYQIQASIATEDGMLRGDTTKGRILKTAGKTAVGAGLGAALGTAMGPLSGGSVGKGAIYGTAIGAGVGAAAAALDKGNAVTVTTGDQLQIKLDQPIIVQTAQ